MNDELKEIFTISAEYQNLSQEKRDYVLLLLLQWATLELKDRDIKLK